jgi:hypothetical protein
MSPLTVSALAVGVLLLVWAVTLCITRARRLDRLHVRMDAARAGLQVALQQRWAAADLAVAAPGDPGGAALRAAVALARGADAADREAAENTLGRALAALDRARLPGPAQRELAEAELMLALARRVHNDAVRDTLALRSRRLVRWLHLAGTAPMPVYFEIADPASRRAVTTPAPAGDRDAGAGAAY